MCTHCLSATLQVPRIPTYAPVPEHTVSYDSRVNTPHSMTGNIYSIMKIAHRILCHVKIPKLHPFIEKHCHGQLTISASLVHAKNTRRYTFDVIA